MKKIRKIVKLAILRHRNHRLLDSLIIVKHLIIYLLITLIAFYDVTDVKSDVTLLRLQKKVKSDTGGGSCC